MDFTRRKIVATPASVSFITEKVGKNFFRNVIVANSKAKNVSKEISNLANELVQECTNTSDMMPMYDSLAKLTNASLQLSSEHWISAEDVCDEHNVENNTIILVIPCLHAAAFSSSALLSSVNRYAVKRLSAYMYPQVRESPSSSHIRGALDYRRNSSFCGAINSASAVFRGDGSNNSILLVNSFMRSKNRLKQSSENAEISPNKYIYTTLFRKGKKYAWRKWFRWHHRIRSLRSVDLHHFTSENFETFAFTLFQNFSIEDEKRTLKPGKGTGTPLGSTHCNNLNQIITNLVKNVGLASILISKILPSSPRAFAAVDYRGKELVRSNEMNPLSYGELYHEVVSVASFLQDECRILDGERVGILSTNSTKVFVVHYACAMINAVTLNLNTHLAPNELAYILCNSGCSVLILPHETHSNLLLATLSPSHFQDHSESEKNSFCNFRAVIWLPSSLKCFPNKDRYSLQNPVNGDIITPYLWEEIPLYGSNSVTLKKNALKNLNMQNYAHLYYTSGTTGKPKGVALSHNIVKKHADAVSFAMSLNASDVWLHAAPIFHLVDAFAIYAITRVGGCHIFLSKFEPGSFLDAVEQEGVTCTNVASSMVIILSNNSAINFKDTTSLRIMSCGGSSLPSNITMRAIGVFGCEFFISYGMTECCGKISTSKLTCGMIKSPNLCKQLECICTSGRPFPMTEIKVLHQDTSSEVPIDGASVGEVWIKGSCLFDGYWNSNFKEQGIFSDDGWFNTGDLGYIQDDGYLVIVDRKKDMILSGGENVYSVEVESAISAHPDVKQVAIYGTPHSVMGEVVNAAITLKENSYTTESEIIEYCHRKLSSYKVPSFVHFLDVFPINASGKILKRRLREDSQNGVHHSHSRKQIDKDIIRSYTVDGKTSVSRQFSEILTVSGHEIQRNCSTILKIPSVQFYELDLDSTFLDSGYNCLDKEHVEQQNWLVIGQNQEICSALRSSDIVVHVDEKLNAIVGSVTSSWHCITQNLWRVLISNRFLFNFIILIPPKIHEMNLSKESAIDLIEYFKSYCRCLVALMHTLNENNYENIRFPHIVVVNRLQKLRCSFEDANIFAAVRQVVNAEFPQIRVHSILTDEKSELGTFLRALMYLQKNMNQTKSEIFCSESKLFVPIFRTISPKQSQQIGINSLTTNLIALDGCCVITGAGSHLASLQSYHLVKIMGYKSICLISRTIGRLKILSEKLQRMCDGIRVLALVCNDESELNAALELAKFVLGPISLIAHLEDICETVHFKQLTESFFEYGSITKLKSSLAIRQWITSKHIDTSRRLSIILSPFMYSQLNAEGLACHTPVCAVEAKLFASMKGHIDLHVIRWGILSIVGTNALFRNDYVLSLVVNGISRVSPIPALVAFTEILRFGIPKTDNKCIETMCNIWEIRTLKENTSACSQSFDSRDKSTIQRINSSEKSIFDKILDCVRCKVEELLPEVQNFTINSPLFSIGLTSSKVSRLNALIEKDLDISLPATLVFDFPTILDIAHFLVSSQGKAKADDLMKIVEFSFAEHLINMETFDENTPFSSLGINSANVLSITSSLNSNLRDMVDEDLPSTVIFDYPTKTSLASFIASKLNVEEGEGELLSSYRTNCENPCPKNSGDRITYLDKFDVIFPNSLNTYDVITRVPLDRWDLTNLSKSGIQVPSYFGGFIKNIGFFDASFALLSVQEALWVDPQQRLVLVCALKLNRVDLHILDEKQRKNHSSVFIGISQIEYPRINAIHASQRLSPYYATGSHLSVCAGRISYVLGLSGPSIAVDTACSSSLVSISMAHESLSRLISDHAFCGGVNMILDVRWNFACQAAKMLADDGRCKTFDYHGDGYVRTEACGVLVITSQNCSRHSLLVHGSSVNQDGRSSSLTAPHGPSQQAVIHEALSYSNANSPQLNLLHSHGTGTALGDPIEVGAVMDTVCSKNILFKDCLTICASKSILGHAEPASGIASMYFLCGALGYESCGQISHLRELNHHISVILRKHKHYFNFNRQTSYASIRSNHMIGSCSAFAFQGTNAHAALKRWIASFHPYLMKHMHFDDKLLWLSSTHSSLYPSCFFSSTDSIVFEVSYSELSSSEFQDHKVFGARICPAAGYFNLALLAPHQSMLQLAESSLCGDMFTISSPYLLSSSGKLRIILFLDFGICKIVSRNNKHMSGRFNYVLLPQYNCTTTSRNNPNFNTKNCKNSGNEKVHFFAHVERGYEVHQDNILKDICMLDCSIHLAEAVHGGSRIPISANGILLTNLLLKKMENTSRAICAGDSVVSVRHNSSHFHKIACSVISSLELRHISKTWSINNSSQKSETIRNQCRKDGKVVYHSYPLRNPEPKYYFTNWFSRILNRQKFVSSPFFCIKPNLQSNSLSEIRCSTDFLSLYMHQRGRIILMTRSSSDSASTTLNKSHIDSALWAMGRTLLLEPTRYGENICAFNQDVHSTRSNERNVEDIDDSSMHDPWCRTTYRGGTTLRAKLCSEGLCNESQVSNDLRRITSQLKHIKVSRYHRQNFRIFFRNTFTMYPERLLISSDTIITGGLGAVGKLITKWLSFDVSHSNIYLLSRRGRSNTYSHLKASTEPSINAVITIESKDCATSESVSGWRFALSSSLRIFHAAGSLADSIFFRQNYGRFCFVFSGKSIAGNLLIEKICTGFPLEVMILFSSTTSLLGNPGQSPYGAANAVLESIAHGNFKKGLHIKSPQFGALGGMFGMAVKKSKHLERSGIGFLEPFDCIVCVSQIMQCAQPGVFAIAAIDWTRYISLGSSSSFFHFNNSPQIKLKEKIISSNLESSIRDTISQSLYKLLNRKIGDLDPLLDAGLDSLSAVHLSSILEEKIPGVRCPSTLIFDYPTPGELCAFIENQVRKKNTETYTQSTQPTKNERRGYILDTHKTVQKIIVQILGHSINQSSPLMDAGFDSINAIEFTQAIQAAFPNATDEQILPATLIFDYPTIADIVNFLEKKPYASIDESHTGDTEILVNRQDIDFVCFEMCIPESSLRRGVKFDDSICCVPIDRWDIESKGWSFKLPQFAGFLTNVMKFDSSKYNLNSQEAKFIDPQQRFMLTKFEEVLDLESDRIMSGVFVGISTTDYDKRIRELPEQLLNSRVSVTATAFVSVVPGRVSFVLNLCGPSVAIDTACSSGLVAVHIASGYSIKIAKTVSSFQNLMGAVNMIIYAPTSLLFKRAGMLADDGRCKTLDSGADGYVRAEACIAARLGPSHENISVLLSGTAVNQDGRSSSLTAPNGPSQRSVTRMAKCSCDGYLTTIGISIHGTGTPLGDPIEIGALDKDWIFSTSILATKTMFGHAESPAGLLSLAISASYFITEQKCTATLHLRNLSKHVVASISIFEKKMCIQRSLMPKVVQNNDSIGVNAFAFQGTNAHAILSLCRPSEQIFQHFPRCLYLNDQRDYWFTIKFHRIIMKVRTQSDIVIFYITMKRVLNSCIDHIVHGSALFPASGTLEVFRVTAKMISEMIPVLSHITFGRPLILQAALNSVCCRFTTGTNSVELSTLHPEHEQYKIALALVNETRYSSEHGKGCVGRNSFFSLCSTTSQHLMDHFALCLVMNTSRTDSGGCGITPAELDAGFHSMAALWTARAPLKIPAACEAYFFVLKSYAHSKFRRRNSRNTSIPISSRRSTQTDHMILGSKLASLLTKQLSNSNNECQKSDSKSNLKSFVEICPNTQGNIYSVEMQAMHKTLNEKWHPKKIASSMGNRICPTLTQGIQCSAHFQSRLSLEAGKPLKVVILCARLENYQCSNEGTNFERMKQAKFPVTIRASITDILTYGNRNRLLTWLINIPDQKSNTESSKSTCLFIAGGLGALGSRISKWFEGFRKAAILVDSRVGRSKVFPNGNHLYSNNIVVALKSTPQYCHVQNSFFNPDFAIMASGSLRDSAISFISVSDSRYVDANKFAVANIFIGKCRNHPYFRIIAFSSIASLLGSRGQACYASSNSSLELLSLTQNFCGMPTFSIQWGPWSGGGMAESTVVRKNLERLGMLCLKPATSISTLLYISQLHSNTLQYNCICIVRMNWQKYFEHSHSHEKAFFSEISDHLPISNDNGSNGSNGNDKDIPKLHIINEEQNNVLPTIDTITSKVATCIMCIIGRKVNIHEPLMDAGLDSLTVLDVKTDLEKIFQIAVPNTIIFDFPTTHAIASYLHGLQTESETKSIVDSDNTCLKKLSTFALIHFRSFNSQESLSNDVIENIFSVPTDRWQLEVNFHYPRARFGNFLRKLNKFDNEMYSLHDAELTAMDPQQKLLLISVLRTCYGEFNSTSFQNDSANIVLGIANRDFDEILSSHAKESPHAATGSAFGSVAAGRVSFIFNMQGVSIAVDTACSSSLVATHTAEALGSKIQSRFSVVSGVNLMIQPTISDRFTVAGMLSSSGRCKTLDAFADGYVRAEACLSLLLINTDTMAQNNYVQHVRKESVLVLHGSAVNQDGRSSALTAPRGPSQSEVIMKATNSQTKFLCMVQLHGTGTSLGDPIEIGALSIFLHKKSMIGFSDEVLKLDGMKSWMGHAEPAAGIFGLSEICENVACKSHNGQNLLLKLNPYISSIYDANGTICVSREGVWFEGQCQNSLSGVSAFAFQGTNAHCVARYLDYFNCRSFHLIMNMKSASTLLLRCQHFKCTLQGISQSVHIEFDLSCKFGVLDHCIMGHYLFPAAGYFQLTTELKSMFSDGFPVKGGVEMNTEGVILRPLILTELKTLKLMAKMHAIQGKLMLEYQNSGVFASQIQLSNAKQKPDSLLIHQWPYLGTLSFILTAYRKCTLQRRCRDESVNINDRASYIDALMHLAAPLNAKKWLTKVPCAINAYYCHLDRLPNILNGSLNMIEPRSNDAFSLSEHFMYFENTNPSLRLHSLLSKAVYKSAPQKYNSVSNKLDVHRYIFISNECVTHNTRGKQKCISRQNDKECMRRLAKITQLTSINIQMRMVTSFYHDDGFLRSARIEGKRVISQQYFSHRLIRIPVTSQNFGKKSPSYHECYLRIDLLSMCRKMFLKPSSTVIIKKRYPSSLLIPGGTGSIGMCTVTWYAQTFHGPKHILIPCRSGRSRTFYAKQFRSRVQIQLCCSDVSASSCLTPCSLEPDSWIFHVSGCISDAALHNQTMASIRYVFAPKYTAALKLSEKNAQHPIRAFIGFSSISALVGSAGQSNYAAANASIDAFSAQECHIGRVFTSIQWGPWIGLGGMVSQNIKTMQRMEALGTGFIDSYTGIQILKFIVNSIPYHNGPFVASPFRWDKFIPRQPIGTLVTCIYNEVGSCLRNNLNLSKQKIDHKSTNVSLMEVKDIIHSVLTKKIGDIVSFDAPLMEAGLDSLSVIDVRESLEKIFRIELPVSIFFDYPTAEATTKYIASLLNDDGQLKSNECMDECLYFQRRTRNDDISISAYSGGNPHQLEDNINAVPLVRWDTDLAERNHLHGGKFAGFCTISTLAFFDIKLFSFGEKEALYIDPRQRLLLFQVSSILKEKTLPHALQQYLAVVIGASGKDYVRLLEQWVFEDNCTYTGIGNELSVLSGRISYTFDCKSKCLVIDTACSSSLVGVHIAKEDCLFGYSKGALSAGASIIVTSELHKVLGGAGMLSLCGRCKTLEASADGYSRAECIVTVLLVNASTMLVEDKCDPILIGSSVNQDGRSSSLTAPNGPSQHEVIKNSVLNTDGEDSRIIQIHGTGTALGDPLEVAALISALSLTKNIIIESIKTWMGHAEPAAGILGMTALLSAQASVKTPGFCHLRNFNPHVVAASQKHSTTRKVRQNSYLLDHTCGGVSAFAFQGTNVHCSILSAGYHSNQSALRFLHNHLYWPVLQDIMSRLFFLSVNVKIEKFQEIQIQFQFIHNTKFDKLSAISQAFRATNLVLGHPETQKILSKLTLNEACLRKAVTFYYCFAAGTIKTRCNSLITVVCFLTKNTRLQQGNLPTFVIFQSTHQTLPVLSVVNVAEKIPDSERVDKFLKLATVSFSTSELSCVHILFIPGLWQKEGRWMQRLFESSGQVSAVSTSMVFICMRKKVSGKGLCTMGKITRYTVRQFSKQKKIQSYSHEVTEVSRLTSNVMNTLVNIFNGAPVLIRSRTAAHSCVRSICRVGINEECIHTKSSIGPSHSKEELHLLVDKSEVEIQNNTEMNNVVIAGGTGAIGFFISLHLCSDMRMSTISISGLSGRLNNSKFPVILRCCGSIEISRYFSSRQVKYSKPPHLVVYASGCLSDAALRNQTMASIRYVFAPKNKLLKSMSKENSCRPIFKIIGFSSISALVGSAGQSNYAAANASIDAFSAQECHIGRVFTSIQWGPWIGLGGMVSQNIKTMQRMEALGLDGIKPLPGIRAFEICMKSILFHSVETICGFKWEAFLSQFNLSDEDRETYILFKISVKPESIDRKDHATVSKHDIKLNTKERAQYVIKRAVKDALGFKVHENEPLINSGLDSLSSQELIARISEELGINLPVTVIYDHPSVNALVTRCSDVKKIDYLQPVQKRTNECQIPHSSSSFIIGHSGVFCGGNCDEHLLYSSGCSTNVIPLTRWDTFSVSEQLISSKSMDTVPLHFCATISSSLLTTFDHRIFGISQAESMCIDPQQRLIVESTLQTLQITCSHDSSNMDVATFVGIQHMEYNLLNQGINCIGEPYIATGSALSVAAGRISFIFDFNGPAVSIDTACSASLATVHFAYNSSNLEIFCCGVNLTLTWENFASIQRAGMLTQDGRCKTLDARADGYGRGESSIVARVAKFDSESIKSTKYTRNAWKCDILASAMNQDGRSSSLTAPSGIAQQRVLNSAAKDLNQKQLGSVGLHGTGTSLGDPIELGALSQTLEFLCLTHVSIMASKIQASHTETAAGLVSLVQIVSSLDFELRAPFDHIIYVNPYVVTSFSGKCSTFLFERMSMPTTQAAPAGVSAFAFMGTNVHVIIEYRNINLYSKLRIQSCNRIMLFNRKYSWNETEIGKILLCCAFFTHARNDNVNLLFYPTRERNFNNIVLAEVMITCAFTLKGQAAFLTHASFCSPKGITRAMQSNEVEISMHPKSGQIHCKNTDVKLAVCTIHAMYIYSELQKRLHHLELGGNMNTNMNALKCIVHVPSAKNTHVSSAIEVFLLNTCLKSIGFFVSIQSTNKFLIAREILVGFSIYCRDIIFSRITDHGAENAYFEHQTENTEKSENTYSLNCINNGKELGRIVSQSLELILGRNIGECELFQDLGLDSIGCVEVANHIRRDLELEFDISEVAALPTKRAIIEHLGHLQIENEKTEPRNTTILTTQNIQSINDDNGMQSTMTKVLRPTFEALPLFLGAPAFGDGPLAYMRLINTLNLGHHPVITLERDTTKQAWPNAAEVHAQTIMKQQRRGIITLGGHSLGGVLAIETAVSLELCGREVGVVLLFDAPHPVQFKSEWGIESSSNLDCSNTSTGLEYMEIALTSFHFDTTAAGWRNLDKIQKYSIFEDVMFQALGREIDARDLDEQISGGPYADQWNSGITRNPHNRTCDVSNWKLLRGSDENQVKYTAREANEEISKQCKNFHRVEAKVVQFKACNESAALFEIDLFMDKSQSEILRSVSGYVWPLACNNVEIVRCRGSHMNLMTPDIDGGDLSHTIGPLMNCTLNELWGDIPRSSTCGRKADLNWSTLIWNENFHLPLWVKPSTQIEEVLSSSSNTCASLMKVLLPLDYDCDSRMQSVFGLNEFSWDASGCSNKFSIFLLLDMLVEVDQWSKLSLFTNIPVFGIHITSKVYHFSPQKAATEVLALLYDAFPQKFDKVNENQLLLGSPTIGFRAEMAFHLALHLQAIGIRESTSFIFVNAENRMNGLGMHQFFKRKMRKTKNTFLKSLELQAFLFKIRETEVNNIRDNLERCVKHTSDKKKQKNKYGKKLRRYSADAIYNFTRMNRPKRVRCLDWNVQLSHKLISTRNLSRMTKSFSNQLK